MSGSLNGRTIVVTRSRKQAETFARALERAGARVVALPTIETVDPESWDAVDDSIRLLAEGAFDCVAFTSANGVEGFFKRLRRLPSEVFRDVRVAAVGVATARAVEAAGVMVDLVPESYTAGALAAALGGGGGSILLPRAADVPPELVDVLVAGGWDVHEVAVYRTIPASDEDPAVEIVRAGKYDAVTFTSASTVKGFVGMLGVPPELQASAGSPEHLVACIGPVTAKVCSDLGLRVDVVAEEHTSPGLIEALIGRIGGTIDG
jgi:uroporphyrinogen-III synthase